MSCIHAVFTFSLKNLVFDLSHDYMFVLPCYKCCILYTENSNKDMIEKYFIIPVIHNVPSVFNAHVTINKTCIPVLCKSET